MAKLNETAVAKINEICDRYVSEKTPLIMILSDIQNEYGYIPLEVQEIVSKRTGISVAEIYGVVERKNPQYCSRFSEIKALSPSSVFLPSAKIHLPPRGKALKPQRTR